MNKIVYGFSVAIVATTPAQAQQLKLKPLLDTRIRYEHVDQDGFSRDADAITLRTRFGGELSLDRFSVLGEMEGLLALDESYNSGVNGRATFPIVADPENVEVNRIQLQYKSPALTLTGGRQRIQIEDQRFVGGVLWRQNEQTFDGVRAEYTGIANMRVDVSYVWSVRTLWGVDGGRFGALNRPTSIDGDNVFATASYKFAPGTLTAFAYLIDQESPVVALRRNSSQTYGARFTGATPLGQGVKLNYAASYARQSDYTTNPVRYGADYATGELALDVRRWRFTGGYELLGSDGDATGIAGGFALQTPLSTIHKFDGWADKFLTTPQTGLQKSYGTVTYTLPKVGRMGPLTALVTYLRFDSDRGGIHYGNEWDAQVTLKVSKRLLALLKYADYDRKGIASFPGDADTRKFWAELNYSL